MRLIRWQIAEIEESLYLELQHPKTSRVASAGINPKSNSGFTKPGSAFKLVFCCSRRWVAEEAMNR
jgi:hypothetical protein